MWWHEGAGHLNWASLKLADNAATEQTEQHWEHSSTETSSANTPEPHLTCADLPRLPLVYCALISVCRVFNDVKLFTAVISLLAGKLYKLYKLGV